MLSAHQVAERFLAASVEDVTQLADLYADNVVIEMPFAAPLFPVRRETTREELRQGFSRATDRRYTGVENATIHEMADPETVVLEYDLHGVHESTGEEFVLSYIMVMTVRDGLIVNSRDYSNLVQAAQAFGLEGQLIDALRA
jgi:ketosteroid isomerase-like protein